MKRLFTWLLCFALLLTTAAYDQQSVLNSTLEPSVSALSSVPSSEEPSLSESSEEPEPGILIAYFSQYAFLANNACATDGISSASVAPGDVERIAGMIQEVTSGDLFAIMAAEPYSSDYGEVADRSRKEAETRPALAALVKNMEQYDTIFIGYPVWSGTYPMPAATFLES